MFTGNSLYSRGAAAPNTESYVRYLRKTRGHINGITVERLRTGSLQHNHTRIDETVRISGVGLEQHNTSIETTQTGYW